MARGPKKHQKKIAAPKSWFLGKAQGLYAVRPSQGPHKRRECIPLSLLLQNKLKYALNYKESKNILHNKAVQVKVDGKARTNFGFPLGIMDVVTIDKSNDKLRILYDNKGRFYCKTINDDESKFKLLKVTQKALGANAQPYIVTHDSRTFRFPNPDINVGDVLKYNIEKNSIEDFIKLELGNLAYAVGGNNIGRVGVITNIEKHPGTVDIIHVKDTNNNVFSTRSGNIFPIGKGKKSWISLPPAQGLWLNALEEKQRHQANKQKATQ